MMRASGLLMHISSLPGDHGIGKLGKEAYAFADFLKKGGTEILADTACFADQLRRLTLPELFGVRGQPLLHRL